VKDLRVALIPSKAAAKVLQVLAHGGMGYASEYHVERYLRECFVPRIAPVSRVSGIAGSVRRMIQFTDF